MAKILIADDMPFNNEYVEEQLQILGHEVVTSIDGDDALEKIEATKPDLVLLDYAIPKRDGTEVLKILRANPEYKSLPVITTRARKELEDQVSGFEAGADDYVTKPFHFDELAARIKAQLRLRLSQAWHNSVSPIQKTCHSTSRWSVFH